MSASPWPVAEQRAGSERSLLPTFSLQCGSARAIRNPAGARRAFGGRTGSAVSNTDCTVPPMRKSTLPATLHLAVPAAFLAGPSPWP